MNAQLNTTLLEAQKAKQEELVRKNKEAAAAILMQIMLQLDSQTAHVNRGKKG